MNKLVGLIVLIVVIGGGWYMLHGASTTEPAVSPEESQTTVGQANTVATTTPTIVTITYTDTGFSPADITVPLGTTVTFVNQSTKSMWVASAAHPSHAVYDGTTKNQHCTAGYTGPVPFDECKGDAAGASYSFTFTRSGEWKYHDHITPTKFGSITVTEASTATPI